MGVVRWLQGVPLQTLKLVFSYSIFSRKKGSHSFELVTTVSHLKKKHFPLLETILPTPICESVQIIVLFVRISNSFNL